VLLAALPPAELDQRLGEVRAFTGRTVVEPQALREILSDVRASGYCLVDQELEEGLRSIAVPIRDSTGRVVAAANVSTHTSRGTPAWLRDEALLHLRACALGIQADLKVARPGR